MVNDPKSRESAKLLIPPAPEPPYKEEAAKEKGGMSAIKSKILGGRKEKHESEHEEKRSEKDIPKLIGDVEEDIEKLEKTRQPHHVEAREDEGSPPLFIKIDKYSEVVKNMHKLKSYSLGLRDALDALADIEKELSTGLTIANRALDNFNTIISLLDAKLLRMSGVDVGMRKEDVPEELDDYIRQVYNQMEKVKHELKTISR
jgi:hypothetical protein